MKPASRRRLGKLVGLVAGGALVAFLCAPGNEHLHAAGPMNTGHGEVACAGCHRTAQGTLRQQLGAAARTWVGIEATRIDVGYRAVTNDECVACHVRPDDRHPVFRFLEPRFADARAAIHPERCTSCHGEHQGTRVTTADLTFCRHCHTDIQLDADPLDVPHETLAATGQWESCLGCHDFHGNHAGKPPPRMGDAHTPTTIRTYLDGGPSPYGPAIRRAITPEQTP